MDAKNPWIVTLVYSDVTIGPFNGEAAVIAWIESNRDEIEKHGESAYPQELFPPGHWLPALRGES